MMQALKKFFDILANMGIWIRLNDPRTEPPDEEGRLWGPVVNGLAISIETASLDSMSILIKNVGTSNRHIEIPGWLSFYRVHVKTPFNLPAPMKSFGRESILSDAKTGLKERAIDAGKSLATEMPLSPLFDLRARGIWQIKVTAEVEGAELVSNELKIQRP